MVGTDQISGIVDLKDV